MAEKMTDVLIIGSGPAGISAALYTLRAGLSTTIMSFGNGALESAEMIENYYGVGQITGGKLKAAGISQAKALGAVMVDAQVTSVSAEEYFTVETTAGELTCKALIIATGMQRTKPTIAGLDELAGGGVSYCAVCDGFFFKGREVGVLGEGAYAIGEAHHLAPLASRVTIFTNGRKLEADIPPGVEVETGEIKRILTAENFGKKILSGVELADGRSVPIAGLFVAEGMASAASFALKLGLITDKNAIKAENQETNIKGVFAAGDCTGGKPQVAVAVGQGANAGMQAAKYVREI